MKKKEMLVWTAGIVSALAMFAGCGAHSGEKEHAKAMDAWDAGDLVRARALFEKSIRKTSDSTRKANALNSLGLVLWELGETGAAADAFAKSANLSDSFTDAHENLGIALYHAGRRAEAEMALNNIAGDNPKNATAHTLLGYIELEKQAWPTAAAELAKSLAAQPDQPAVLNALALAELNGSGGRDRAIQRLKQLLAAHPEYAPAAFNLAAIYDFHAGDKASSLEWYRKYLRLAGTQGERSAAAAQAIVRLGGNGGGTPQADPSLAAQLMAQGTQLHAAQKYAEAAECYRKAAAADPGQKNAPYNLGLAYYAMKNYSEAALACGDALRIDPQFADARYMLSLSWYQLGKLDDAEREAKILQATDPKRAEEMLRFIAAARKR